MKKQGKLIGYKAVYDSGESLADPQTYYPLKKGYSVECESGLWLTTDIEVAIMYAKQHGSHTILKVSAKTWIPDPDGEPGAFISPKLTVEGILKI